MLSREEAQTLIAFLDAFDLCVTGAWSNIEATMRDDFGIPNPEEALEGARVALQDI